MSISHSTSAIAAALSFSCVLAASAALAGPIERACLRSDRDAANRSVCSCIQQVADTTLTGSDQGRAAKFFTDPDKAHDTWLSTTGRDNAFWDRYLAFGQAAELNCSGV